MSSSKIVSKLSALKQTIDIPVGLFIDGEFRKGTGSSFYSINPETEKPVISEAIQGASRNDVDDAVKAARAAFETTWGQNVSGPERSALMRRLADLIDRDTEKLAIVEAIDGGKTINWCEGDIADAAACLRYYAGWADKISGQTLEVSTANKMSMTLHEPIGVVGQIVPFNYPIMMAGWAMAPALAVGCSIVFKPAEATPLTTLLLAQLVKEAGFPNGVFNVVNGLGRETGAALSEHHGIDKISFTGSTATGRSITVAAAQSNLKKVTLELGGKSPSLVFDSADIDEAVKWSAFGVFENAGQSCSAGTRLLVHENVYDDFVKKLAQAADEIKLGHVLDRSTQQGPQIHKAQFEKVLSYIEAGKKEGARLVTGGKRLGDKGYFIRPTVFADVNNSEFMVEYVQAQEEIFGPVVVVIPFKTEDEAVKMANDTSYGLAAAIYSKNADQVGRLMHKLKAGTVWVNQYTMLSHNTPFGGYKQSGWGRQLGSYGLEAYMNVKGTLIMSLMGGNAGGSGMSNGGNPSTSGSGGPCQIYPLTVDNIDCLPAPPKSQIALAVVLGSVGIVGYIAIVILVLLLRKSPAKARTSSPLPFSFTDHSMR
ncbi:aldehyde dehydrogenase [Wallemia mellicola]|uniref:Aldehyde dehydrogenase n=1 Tax=Wallemia mellicola TaxID=1708541 RepID=A0A4T0Q261_9BASI|nr:aldehyde dehydrogenase [Wallemia mellicola]TIC00307.1 aldehyde dehydrogenase [Wallemia mellicola]TIC04363.1 aldehyde dehydrogenase [Wallemia mellicola]TIC13656.1 aldehyde dehydrogenase [Wallemia mellicola]TIC17670.1 aldehyde dehydrogenase [Wallemia mellicola]